MATVPAPITWVTGVVVTAAQLNTNIRDAFNFFILPPLCVLRQTSTQSIADGTLTGLNFDTEDIDRDGGHSTVSATSRYTAQTTGWYDLAGTYAYASTGGGAGSRQVALRLNGSGVGQAYQTMIANANLAMTTTAVLFLNFGDYVECVVKQFNTGSALLTDDTTYGNCRYQIKWISS